MWRQHRTSILLACSFLVMLSAFWFFQQLAFVVFIALLVSLLLHPLVERIHKLRLIPRGFSAALSLFLFIVITLSIFTVLSATLATSIQNFAIDLPTLSKHIHEKFSDYPFVAQQVEHLWGDLSSISVNAVRSSLFMAISFFNKVFDVVMILFTSFYFLADGGKIQKWIARLFPVQDHLRVFRLFSHILRSLNIYIYSQLAICFLMGFLVFLFFTARSLPYPAVFAVISGVSEFIPVVGPTIASVFGIAVAATIGPTEAIHTAMYYLFITQVNHNVIYPLLIGRSLHLHPLAIILSIMLGGTLLGAPGMFLAVPFVIIIRFAVLDIYLAAKRQRIQPAVKAETDAKSTTVASDSTVAIDASNIDVSTKAP